MKIIVIEGGAHTQHPQVRKAISCIMAETVAIWTTDASGDTAATGDVKAIIMLMMKSINLGKL